MDTSPQTKGPHFEMERVSSRLIQLRPHGKISRAVILRDTVLISELIDRGETPVSLAIDISDAGPSGPTAPPAMMSYFKSRRDDISRVALFGASLTGPRGFLINMVKRIAPVELEAFETYREARDWLLLDE